MYCSFSVRVLASPTALNPLVPPAVRLVAGAGTREVGSYEGASKLVKVTPLHEGEAVMGPDR